MASRTAGWQRDESRRLLRSKSELERRCFLRTGVLAMQPAPVVSIGYEAGVLICATSGPLLIWGAAPAAPQFRLLLSYSWLSAPHLLLRRFRLKCYGRRPGMSRPAGSFSPNAIGKRPSRN